MFNTSEPQSLTADDGLDDPAAVRAAQRDPTAFALLYRRYVTPVYRYIYSRVGNAADAEDLTAQVFLAALEGLPRYQEQGHFAAWLFTLARRRLTDHWRKPPATSLDEIPEPLDEHDLHEQASQAEMLAQLRLLVRQLSNEEQELLRLRFAAGLKYEQIAAVMGRKEATVKMTLHRLLHRLNVRWGAQDEQTKHN
jgi:RNA polymerase sigma-70 factor (ECF subfamily)